MNIDFQYNFFETGNTYTAETKTDIIEIPTANLGLETSKRSQKVLEHDCDRGRSDMAKILKSDKVDVFNHKVSASDRDNNVLYNRKLAQVCNSIFRCHPLPQFIWIHFCRASTDQNPQIYR